MRGRTSQANCTRITTRIKTTLVRIIIAPCSPNVRAEWGRANDFRMQTEARTRHPLQHDSSARSQRFGVCDLRRRVKQNKQNNSHTGKYRSEERRVGEEWRSG